MYVYGMEQFAIDHAKKMVDAALASLADGESLWLLDRKWCDMFCDDDKGGNHIVGECMVEVWPDE